jgi:hypothetical protein
MPCAGQSVARIGPTVQSAQHCLVWAGFLFGKHCLATPYPRAFALFGVGNRYRGFASQRLEAEVLAFGQRQWATSKD